MKKTQHPVEQKGFTLIEMLTSVTVSGIVILTVMGLLNITQSQWKKGIEVKALTTEMALALGNIKVAIQSTSHDSIVVSSGRDTLKIGGGIKIFRDNANNLVYDNNGNPFDYLEGMVQTFSAETPIIGASGDTLKMVAITLVAEENTAHDSTTVWVTPRAQ